MGLVYAEIELVNSGNQGLIFQLDRPNYATRSSK
jgi:hypothetical protein